MLRSRPTITSHANAHNRMGFAKTSAYFILGFWLLLWIFLLLGMQRLPDGDGIDQMSTSETASSTSTSTSSNSDVIHTPPPTHDDVAVPSEPGSEQKGESKNQDRDRDKPLSQEERRWPRTHALKKPYRRTKENIEAEYSTKQTEKTVYSVNDVEQFISKSTKVTIVAWNALNFYPREMKQLEGCPIPCFFTSDRAHHAKTADAILWHSKTLSIHADRKMEKAIISRPLPSHVEDGTAQETVVESKQVDVSQGQGEIEGDGEGEGDVKSKSTGTKRALLSESGASNAVNTSVNVNTIKASKEEKSTASDTATVQLAENMFWTKQRYAMFSIAGGNPFDQLRGKEKEKGLEGVGEQKEKEKEEAEKKEKEKETDVEIDLRLSYVVGTENEHGGVQHHKSEETLAAAFFPSGCGDDGKGKEEQSPQSREVYLESLREYIAVDSYGLCEDEEKDPEGFNTAPDVDLIKKLSRYKFVFVFERDDAKVISPKFYDVLLSGSVPVYRPSQHTQHMIEESAPKPQSFIQVASFKTPRHLAEHLIELDYNNDLYDSYVRWRFNGLSWKQAKCRLCAEVLKLQMGDLAKVLAQRSDHEKKEKETGDVWYPPPA